MSETLWRLPVPATALTRGPVFTELFKRQCELSFHIESEEGGERRVALAFEGVEAYKCTYLSSMSAEMINCAYGRLVRLDGTTWLAEVSKFYDSYCASAKQTPKDLQHLMICFDDGPCYEFICGAFNAV
jgi:hypothetical protein